MPRSYTNVILFIRKLAGSSWAINTPWLICKLQGQSFYRNQFRKVSDRTAVAIGFGTRQVCVHVLEREGPRGQD